MKIIADTELKMLQHLTLYFGFMAALGFTLWALQIDTHTFELVTGRAALLGLLLVICSGKIKETGLGGQRIRLPLALAAMITGALLSVTTRWYQWTLFKHGIIVAPGTGQVNPGHYNTATTDLLLVAAVVVFLGPALEEFIFRFIGLGVVYKAVIASRLVKREWSGFFLIPWVIVISILFAFMHQPDWVSFPVYFLTSVICSIAYLKYGLFSSMLVHSSGNATILIIMIV